MAYMKPLHIIPNTSLVSNYRMIVFHSVENRFIVRLEFGAIKHSSTMYKPQQYKNSATQNKKNSTHINPTYRSDMF